MCRHAGVTDVSLATRGDTDAPVGGGVWGQGERDVE